MIEADTTKAAAACDICGCAPCQTPGYCQSCRLADQQKRKGKREKIKRTKRNSGDTKSPTQADILIDLAGEIAEFWHSADGIAFVDIRVQEHRETWPLRSRNFKLWLTEQYYGSRGGAPNADALQSALNVLEAQARFGGPERQVSVRIANADDKIYIDLGARDWCSVEIDADGWSIVNELPVRFRRSKGMLPLPVPKPGGDIKELLPFINVKTEEDFALVVAFASRPAGKRAICHPCSLRRARHRKINADANCKSFLRPQLRSSALAAAQRSRSIYLR